MNICNVTYLNKITITSQLFNKKNWARGFRYSTFNYILFLCFAYHLSYIRANIEIHTHIYLFIVDFLELVVNREIAVTGAHFSSTLPSPFENREKIKQLGARIREFICKIYIYSLVTYNIDRQCLMYHNRLVTHAHTLVHIYSLANVSRKRWKILYVPYI